MNKLTEVVEQAWDRLHHGVASQLVIDKIEAVGIGDGGVSMTNELAEKKGALNQFREAIAEEIPVTGRHGVDGNGTLGHLGIEGPGTVGSDVQADLSQGSNGVGGDSVSRVGGNSGGSDEQVFERWGFGGEGMSQEGLTHRATADVGGTKDNHRIS